MDCLAEELSKKDIPTQEVNTLKEFTTQIQQEQQSQVMATSHDIGDWTHLPSVKLMKEGKNLQSVFLDGHHVQKSPLTASVSKSNYYKSMKEPVQTITGIRLPHSIAFNANGDMFVTSEVDNCVNVYDTCGRRKATIGNYGRGDLNFDDPYGIAISGDTVYVADRGNHRVQSFTTSGKFLGKFGSWGFGQGQFQSPIGISISGDNLIYVTDHDNHRIQVFRSDGNFCRSINGNIPGEAAFEHPWGVAIAPDGNVHVAGHMSENVVAFSPEGKFVRSLELIGSTGIAFDSAGYSIVARYRESVAFFDPIGNLIHTLRIPNRTYLLDVQVSKDGSVWVAEGSAHRLYKFGC